MFTDNEPEFQDPVQALRQQIWKQREGTKNINATVNHHYAPTDESLKLLKEIEEKVQGKLVETIRLEVNSLKAVVFAFVTNLGTSYDGIRYLGRFDLNGKTYEVEVIKEGTLYETKHQFIMDLVKRFSEVIAEELLYSSPELAGMVNSRKII